MSNSSIIFNDVSEISISHFKQEGFSHYRFIDHEFLDLIKLCYKYFSTHNGEMAFRNSTGTPRQYIDVVRKIPEIRKLIQTDYIKKICILFLDGQPVVLNVMEN